MASTNTYTKAEVDAMIQDLKDEFNHKIDNTIKLSDETDIPNPEETSLWLKVKNS